MLLSHLLSMKKHREWGWAAFLSRLCLRLPQAQHVQSSSCSMLCCARKEDSLILLPGIPITSAVVKWVLKCQFRMKSFPTSLLQHFPSISALLPGLFFVFVFVLFWWKELFSHVLPILQTTTQKVQWFSAAESFPLSLFLLNYSLKNTFLLWFSEVNCSFWDLSTCTATCKIFFFSFALQNVFSPLELLNNGSRNQADVFIPNSIVSGPIIISFLTPLPHHCRSAGSDTRKLFHWAENMPKEPFSQNFRLWGWKLFITW